MREIMEQYYKLRRDEDVARNEHQAVINRAKASVKAAEEKVLRAKARVEKLEKKQNELPCTGWKEGVVEPLAKILAERAEMDYVVYGPFGICCETCIYLVRDKSVSITKQTTRGIRLEPHFVGDDLVMRYRTGETTNDFAPGTIGHLNGMNCVTAPLPDTIEEIEKLLVESGVSE